MKVINKKSTFLRVSAICLKSIARECEYLFILINIHLLDEKIVTKTHCPDIVRAKEHRPYFTIDESKKIFVNRRRHAMFDIWYCISFLRVSAICLKRSPVNVNIKIIGAKAVTKYGISKMRFS